MHNQKEEQQTKDYLTKRIHPIFEKLIMDLLREQPDDPVLFISEWLINKGNQYRSQSQKDIKPNLQLYHQESFQQQQFGNTIQSNMQDTLNFGKSDVKPNIQASIQSQQEEIKLVDNKNNNNKKQLNKMQTDFKQQQKQQEKDKEKEKEQARENKSSLFKLDTKKAQNTSPNKNDTKNDTKHVQHQQESQDSMQEQFKSNGQSQQLPEIISFQDPNPIHKQELQAPNPFQQKQLSYANVSIQVARSKEGSPVQKPKSSRRLNHHQVVQMSILNQQKPVKKQDLSISQPLLKQELTIPLQNKDKPIEQRQNNSQLNTPKSDDQEFQLIVLEPVGQQPPPQEDIFHKSDQKKSLIIKDAVKTSNIHEEQQPAPLSSQRSPSKKVYIESTRLNNQLQQPINLSQSRSTSKDKQFVFKQQSLVDRIPAVSPKIKNKKYVSKEPEPMRMSQMKKSKKVYQPLQQQQQIQQSGVYIKTEISLSQNNPKSPMQSQRSIQVEEKKPANLEFKELTKEELNKLSKSDKLDYYERKNQIESSKRIEIEREKQYQQQKFSQRSQNSKASYQQEHPREDEHANQFNLENRVHNMSESEPEEDQIQPQQKQSIAEAYGFNNQKQDFNPRIIQKNRDQRERIIKKMASILSFSGLDPQVKQTIINAFEEKKFNPNELVIKQGDDGDQLYLTDQGILECTIKYQNHSEGKYIRSYHPGELFGEQSLLYGTKRSASVQAKNECVLWALDKQTFDHVLKDQWINKRQKHQDFLQQIPILETIQEYEKQQIADQLKEHKQKAGDIIIKQGEQGDALYFVVQGKLKALRMEKGIEQEVHSYKEFDYFGELALLKDIPRQASIICETDCLLYALDKKSFKRLMAPVDEQLKRNAEKYIQNR